MAEQLSTEQDQNITFATAISAMIEDKNVKKPDTNEEIATWLYHFCRQMAYGAQQWEDTVMDLEEEIALRFQSGDPIEFHNRVLLSIQENRLETVHEELGIEAFSSLQIDALKQLHAEVEKWRNEHNFQTPIFIRNHISDIQDALEKLWSVTGRFADANEVIGRMLEMSPAAN